MSTEWNSPELVQRIRDGAMRGVTTWIADVEQRAVRLIMEPPKTGRKYRRRGVTHQASAAGEAPANDTGRLANARQIFYFPELLRARLVFSTDYARHLEYGTKKMQPRPFARRALAESVPDGMAAVKREIEAALR